MSYVTLIQVALGGAIGASLRYMTGVGTIRLFGPGLPWGTFVVNVVGSFIMGVVVVTLAHKGMTRQLAPFLMTGMLGGFTTFSAFSLDVLTMYERGDTTQAALYAAASVFLSLAAIILGLFAARTFWA